MPNKDNLKRYNRNILIKAIDIDGQLKLLNSKVLICGAGGLGSTVISSLTSVGIGTIGIVDNDSIEISNLNRQFIHSFEKIGEAKVNSAKDWIGQYNPDINVKTYHVRLNLDNCDEILKEYDVIVDCFDSFESKFTLNKACVRNKKILVHGGVTEFSGQVMTILPGKTACLNCLFPEFEKNSETKGVLSPAVSTIGSIQAMEVVKILLNFKKLLVNGFLSYDGMEHSLRKITIKQNKNCPVCEKILVK
ncbi:MAG: UBA/ThiF-type NAD/FAD binding protein [uncultured bacterium]|nr:MAG: UBA/ThiF-type NAD/FAD binding protein [uncultured bacterium]HBH19182.1 adenylyltransferase [Cyanobacteria bacterium UBA9579]